MIFKLVVRNETAGREFIGDCIDRIFPYEMYLGGMVEPRGGVFVIIEVECADDEDLSDIELLFEPYLIDGEPHPIYNNKRYLQPVSDGDPLFTELYNNGRARVNIETLREHIMVRE